MRSDKALEDRPHYCAQAATEVVLVDDVVDVAELPLLVLLEADA